MSNHLVTSHAGGSSVVTDNAGNVIVAGPTADVVDGDDLLVIKYSGAGVPMWATAISGGPVRFSRFSCCKGYERKLIEHYESGTGM